MNLLAQSWKLFIFPPQLMALIQKLTRSYFYKGALQREYYLAIGHFSKEYDRLFNLSAYASFIFTRQYHYNNQLIKEE